jgi:cyclophilin family peptidyl-prolyl cis-trans isomerase
MPKLKGKQTKRIRRRDKKPRGVADWSGPAPRHGPFGIFSNIKLFYFVAAFIMAGSVVGGGLGVCVRGRTQTVTPTPEATVDATATAQATPSATDTPVAQVKQYPAAPPMTIDPAKSYSATIKTNKGDIKVELFAKDAPNTVNNFVFLARQGFYNDLLFHIAYPDFYVQTGDPTCNNTGGLCIKTSGPGYDIPKEPNSRPFVAGSLAGVTKQGESMGNGSQFFIALTASKQFETGDYWVFGQVTEGMDVAQKLAQDDKILGIDITEQ